MPKVVKNIPLMDLASFLIESPEHPTHVGVIFVGFTEDDSTRAGYVLIPFALIVDVFLVIVMAIACIMDLDGCVPP